MFKLTVSSDLVNFEPVVAHTLEDVADWCTAALNYSFGTYKDNYRKKDNFEGCNLIGLDFDNDDATSPELTIEAAAKRYSQHLHIIMPTKSHRKEKHGVVKDRFRVIFVLEKPITDQATFAATWAELKKRIGPEADEACKDPSRFFYPSTEVFSINENGSPIPIVAALPAVPKSQRSKAADASVKGELSKKTLNLFSFGAPGGKRNMAVFLAAKDLQQNNYDQSDALDLLIDKLTANGMINDDFTEDEVLTTVRSAYRGDAKHPARINYNKKLKEFIEETWLLVNMADSNETFLFHEDTCKTMPFDKALLVEVLGKDDAATFKSERRRIVSFIYAPFRREFLFTDDIGVSYFNTYRPPQWEHDVFFFGRTIPKVVELPKVYDTFFKHLTDGNVESYEYLLDWLGTALKGRNYTILTAIGEEGIGKGIFGAILEKLFGTENFVKVRDDVFKSKFNGPLLNKRLVYIDEVSISDDQAHNRLKDVVNEKLEIERKGRDAEYVDNYANFYLSSNIMNAIKPGPGDRRFSILELTEKKLTATDLVSTISEMYKQDNINQLAFYLMGREVKRDMLVPFRSQRFDEIIEAGLTDWESWLVFTWTALNIDKEVEISEVQNAIVDKFGRYHSPPGRRKIEALAKKYPQYFKVKKRNGGNTQNIQVIGSPIDFSDTKEGRMIANISSKRMQ